jgi:hypothetical protein
MQTRNNPEISKRQYGSHAGAKDMKINNVRRSQFISPFGIGALQVLRNGISVITAGLDHWYETNAGVPIGNRDLTEFRIDEWRLQQALDVDYFMMPPDYRIAIYGGENKNTYLTVPVLRFPAWYQCTRCGLMKEVSLEHPGYVSCDDCKWRMGQVRFIAMCDQGHIQDFPWLEWVHRSSTPKCIGPLKYTAAGGGSLASIKISCLGCKKERSLGNITSASESGDKTYLSSSLLSSDEMGGEESLTPYLCRGRMPWLGTNSDTPCNRPIRAALRSATNVYYSDVKSSIYLPVILCTQKNDAVEILRKPEIKARLSISKGLFEAQEMVKALRKKYKDEMKDFSDDEIKAGIEIIWEIRTDPSSSAEATRIIDEDRWTAFRRIEYNVLCEPHREDDLVLTPVDTSELSPFIRKYLEKIHLVERLRETRALAGFSRVVADNGMDMKEKQALLRRKPAELGSNWLPAYIVYGEGIFITLNEDILREWKNQSGLKKRISMLDVHYRKVCEQRKFTPKSITPRFVLVHTLAHLLMNRLIYECGYSSAALRERLYVSDNSDAPMAGLLIYTSSGDSEGTLGGLVRMGKPENFEPLLRRSIEAATWCSADPVCSEMGDRGGQGPDSCNLAACHCCCLVPETACEEFNRFLDRSVLISQMDNKFCFFKEI